MIRKYVIALIVIGFLTSEATGTSLIPPGSNPGGQSAEASAQQWMQWAFSFDNVVDGGDPINDTTGAFQNLKQTYPVFMLGGATTTGVTRSFQIPSGKPLAIPLVNLNCVSSNGFDCTDQPIIDFIDGLLDDVDRLYLKIGDEVLVDANTATAVDAIEAQFRITSDVFAVDVAPNNWGGEPAGNWPNSYVAGFFAFVDDLPATPYTIEYGGGFPDFTVGVDATVVPAPAVLPLLLTGLAALGLVARPRREPKA